MSRNRRKLWGLDMLEDIDFVFKSEIPTIEDSTKCLLHKEPFLRKYPFEKEEKALELIDKVLANEIAKRPLRLDPNLVLEPTKEPNLSSSVPINIQNDKENKNVINIFDANNFDDPFHANELNSINVYKELESILGPKNSDSTFPVVQNNLENTDQISKSLSNLLEISRPNLDLPLRPNSHRVNSESDNDSSFSIEKMPPLIEKNSVKKSAPLSNSEKHHLIETSISLGFDKELSLEVLDILKTIDHPNRNIFMRNDDFLVLLENVTTLKKKYQLDSESIVYGCLYHPSNLNESWRIACLVFDVKQLGFSPNDIIQMSIRLQTKDRHEIVEALLDPAKINTRIIQKAQQAKRLEKPKSSRYIAFKK